MVPGDCTLHCVCPDYTCPNSNKHDEGRVETRPMCSRDYTDLGNDEGRENNNRRLHIAHAGYICEAWDLEPLNADFDASPSVSDLHFFFLGAPETAGISRCVGGRNRMVHRLVRA